MLHIYRYKTERIGTEKKANILVVSSHGHAHKYDALSHQELAIVAPLLKSCSVLIKKLAIAICS